ncbi:hypothetical protein BDV96DRAFT_633236 [Lophiotrema nucula]|uniref:Uncharacterized protein n=1 Tax=Lophiotrema nucula TaxID=690887 RepID=A0A6A5Z2V7_9PLEO|nr:hypothetical protein BDV96DRAFT_633236 [Lophiotrema nucula]
MDEIMDFEVTKGEKLRGQPRATDDTNTEGHQTSADSQLASASGTTTTKNTTMNSVEIPLRKPLGLSAHPARKSTQSPLPRKKRAANPIKKPAEKFRDIHKGLGIDLDDVDDIIEPLLAGKVEEVSTADMERFVQVSNSAKEQLEKWSQERKTVEDRILEELRKRKDTEEKKMGRNAERSDME